MLTTFLGSRRSRNIALVASALAVLAIPSFLFGHSVVYPKTSTTGAHEKYVLRVPNEKVVATTRVEIRFSGDLRVSSFADVAGWQLEVLTDSAKRIIGAVWTGNLPPQRFVEFPFVATNPKTAGQLTWPTFQTYADGERVEWTGAPGTKSPASVTTIAEAPSAADKSAPMNWVPWAALGLSIVALGLALRPRSS
ncbi:MAG: DUF1775 domain-containing protein [bacterium]